MILTKRALPRRTFLRGVGATVALPLLDAMVPAFTPIVKTAAKPVQRLGFAYIPNGAVMSKWTPVGEGNSFEFSPILSPLEPFRNRIQVLTGLDQRQAESLGDGVGEHVRATAVWLNGVHPKRTEGADVRAGTTADQVAAIELGKETVLPSLELALEQNFAVGNCEHGYSCVYQNTISWRTPTTPMPMETNPRVVFERLFGDGGSPAERRAQFRESNSILDSVTDQVARLRSTVGTADRERVTEYLDAVREIERRIQRAEANTGEIEVQLPERPVGIPDSFEDHIKLMFDLQVLAYQADITRVISFLIGRETSQRTYPQIGVPDPHHSTSHHQKNAEKLEKLVKINTYHVQMLAYFLDKLRSTPDGDGNLLDHAMILYGGCIRDGDLHNHVDLPLVLAGGGAGQLKGGRHLVYPKNTPMTNLLVTLVDKLGVPVDTLGDSNGKLPLDTLAGV